MEKLTPAEMDAVRAEAKATFRCLGSRTTSQLVQLGLEPSTPGPITAAHAPVLVEPGSLLELTPIVVLTKCEE